MKKADAAAAAELRLAKTAWLPEILTDREVPATPSWENREDEDEDDSDDADTGDGGNETPEGEDGDTEPDAGTGTEHINNTPADAEAVPVASSPLTPWPLTLPLAPATGRGR
jgi:ParB family chromosome partitioning protein